jgi:hypothetical protein
MADDDETNAMNDVLGRLTGEEQEKIVARFTAINRSWTGAQPADILDALYQGDNHLDVREPFWDANPDLEVPEPAGTFAILALIYLDREVTPEAVRELAEG